MVYLSTLLKISQNDQTNHYQRINFSVMHPVFAVNPHPTSLPVRPKSLIDFCLPKVSMPYCLST